MFGRRGYQRFEMRDGAEGVLRVLRDVVVQQTEERHWLAVSREAGVVGEVLTLDTGNHGSGPGVRVRVAESRPVVVNGSVRHRMRLESVDLPSPDCRGNAAQTEAPVAIQALSGTAGDHPLGGGRDE